MSGSLSGGAPGLMAGAYTPPSHQYLRAGPPPARSFGDRLSFETGVSYLAGIVGGGATGIAVGYRNGKAQNFRGWLLFNQVLNQGGKYGGQTGNAFGVFALSYSLLRDGIKYWVRDGEDDPANEAIAAGTIGAIQGMARFGRGGLLVGGVLGGATYAMMSGEGMDAIKSTLPLDKL